VVPRTHKVMRLGGKGAVTEVYEDAARMRATESAHLAAGGHLCGALYMAGYVVECKLKDLLNRSGTPFPRSGQAGHDLRGLWEAAGLRRADLQGHKRAFLDYWSTSIRYTSAVESTHDPADLLKGAKDLASMVNIRIRHACPRRVGRKS
jgi:hypothetical protein